MDIDMILDELQNVIEDLEHAKSELTELQADVRNTITRTEMFFQTFDKGGKQ